jgi:hypothetical protein
MREKLHLIQIFWMSSTLLRKAVNDTRINDTLEYVVAKFILVQEL